MENCLVKKLKAEVNNPDLMKIGEFDIPLPAGTFIDIDRNWINRPVTVSLKSGNVAAEDENGSSISLPDTLEPSGVGIIHKYTAIEDSVLCVTKVYDFNTIVCSTVTNWDIDIKVFEYSPIIWFAQGENPQIHGDIAYVYKLGNTQTYINIGYSNNDNKLYGDLSVFGNCLSLSTLILRFQSGISGSIESMVSKFRANEKTTGSMTISVPTSGIITFNGTGITGTNKTLSWDATTITYDGTTITA